MSEFSPADLSDEVLAELHRMELMLSEQTGQNIVLAAFQKESAVCAKPFEEESDPRSFSAR